MTDIPFEAIKRLVEYLEYDEVKDYEWRIAEKEEVSNHIAISVLAVKDWLVAKGVPLYVEQERELALFLASLKVRHPQPSI